MPPLHQLHQLAVLADVVVRLRRIGVGYVATGGLAAGFHGKEWPTRDLDLIINLAPADAKRLAYALSDRFQCDAAAVERAARESGEFSAIDEQRLITVHFAVCGNDERRHEQFRRRRAVGIEGMHVWLVGPEDVGSSDRS